MEDDDLIPLSALQHYLYCPRQFALIHVERLWAENRFTAEGRILHSKADEIRVESRRGVRTVTAMPLLNTELGIGGVADVVEFHDGPDGERPYPVEYKRGKPKGHCADEVQLCAQALCLEAMLKLSLDEGALYYDKTRRRQIVKFDEELRRQTKEAIVEARALVRAGITPAASYKASVCDACSLIELCQPHLLGRKQSVLEWILRQWRE